MIAASSSSGGSGGAHKKGGGGGESWRQSLSSRPFDEQIAAYRRDALPYFAMLCIIGLLHLIDASLSRVSPAFLHAMCTRLEWHGGERPAGPRTRTQCRAGWRPSGSRACSSTRTPARPSSETASCGPAMSFGSLGVTAMTSLLGRRCVPALPDGPPPGKAMTCIQSGMDMDMLDPCGAAPARPAAAAAATRASPSRQRRQWISSCRRAAACGTRSMALPMRGRRM